MAPSELISCEDFDQIASNTEMDTLVPDATLEVLTDSTRVLAIEVPGCTFTAVE